MHEMAYTQNFPCIIASSMIEGCLDAVKDVTEGVAKYKGAGMNACGTANVADAS